MAIHDSRSQRLFVEQDLASGGTLEADRNQTNYLLNVLRMKNGDRVNVFNGRDGEWTGTLRMTGKKSCQIALQEQTRKQTDRPSFHFLFAPLKQARLDYVVQKAVEMGAGYLQPVITERCQVRKINSRRLQANATEAAEQCGILHVPEIASPIMLGELSSKYEPDFTIVFCDEALAPQCAPPNLHQTTIARTALLVGPEGGFSDQEREYLVGLANTVRLGLGPRILRADTAAVAAMALIQAEIGDWFPNR